MLLQYYYNSIIVICIFTMQCGESFTIELHHCVTRSCSDIFRFFTVVEFEGESVDCTFNAKFFAFFHVLTVILVTPI